jgi:hypothetical protein
MGYIILSNNQCSGRTCDVLMFPDPEPDPALFFSNLQDADKPRFFLTFFHVDEGSGSVRIRIPEAQKLTDPDPEHKVVRTKERIVPRVPHDLRLDCTIYRNTSTRTWGFNIDSTSQDLKCFVTSVVAKVPVHICNV